MANYNPTKEQGGVPVGGTAGDVLKKNSNADYDTVWGPGGGSGGASDYLSTLTGAEIAITGATTLTISRQHLISDSGTPADYTVTLPAVSGNTGKFISIRISPTATKIFTIDGNASETIDGALTRIMWAGESAILYCNGTSWTKIAGKTIPMQASTERTTAFNVVSGNYTFIPVNATNYEYPAGQVSLGSGYINIRRGGIYMIDVYVSAELTGQATPSDGFQSYASFSVNHSTTDTAGASLLTHPSNLAVTPTTKDPAGGGLWNSYINVSSTMPRNLVTGDYVSLYCYHTAGGTWQTRPYTVVYPHLNIVEQPTW